MKSLSQSSLSRTVPCFVIAHHRSAHDDYCLMMAWPLLVTCLGIQAQSYGLSINSRKLGMRIC